MPRPQYDVVKEYGRVARKLSKLGLRTIPFRLSTLIEPFQPVEQEFKLSLKIMEISLKNRLPLIISTKSTLFSKDKWFKLLVELASQNLVVLQMTITTLNDKLQKVLEPKAPRVEDRIEALDRVIVENVPIILRYQPVIPGIIEFEANDILKLARELKVKHVILEFLRCTTDELELYKKLTCTNNIYNTPWEPYSPSRDDVNVVKPPLHYRVKILNDIVELSQKYNVKIALCKEGLFIYDKVYDCCGITYLNNAMLRLTLREVWDALRRGHNYIDYQLLLKAYSENPLYITAINAKHYPKTLRKPLLHHEKVLRSTLMSPHIKRLTPLLELKNGKVHLSKYKLKM